jgi:segregation and condensation protein A
MAEKDTQENERPSAETEKDTASEGSTPDDAAREDVTADGYVRAGSEDLWVMAKGDFDEKATRGYAPSAQSESLRIDVPLFEGPLDLLLHLIGKHAMDIFDIPVAKITEHYLAAIHDLKGMDLNTAGDFLVMASQLAHIKSKMLLPKEEVDEQETDQEDPRAALMRRLLIYQTFKEAAEQLGDRAWLGRDVFMRPESVRGFEKANFTDDENEVPLAKIDIFKLFENLERVLRRGKKAIVHEVILEKLSVGQRINEIVDYCLQREHFTFSDAVKAMNQQEHSRQSTIVTFLAILEMTKLKLLKIHQSSDAGAIYISPVTENLNLDLADDVDTYDANSEESEGEVL